MALNPIKQCYLLLVAASDIKGKEYEDARSAYSGRSGFFMSVLSTKNPGKVHGKFYVFDDNGNIARIVTSPGDITEKEGFLYLKTARSVYAFSKNYKLSEKEEQQLFAYAKSNGYMQGASTVGPRSEQKADVRDTNKATTGSLSKNPAAQNAGSDDGQTTKPERARLVDERKASNDTAQEFNTDFYDCVVEMSADGSSDKVAAPEPGVSDNSATAESDSEDDFDQLTAENWDDEDFF